MMTFKSLLNPWNYPLPPQPVDSTTARLVSWWGLHWALQSAEDRCLELTFTSIYKEEKLSTRRVHWTSTDRKARWENIKIRWRRAQFRPVVNNMKGAREERVVAVETEQRPNKSTSDSSSRGRMWRNSPTFTPNMPQLSLSELSNALWVLSAVVSHFATSLSIQVVGSVKTNTIHYLIQCPLLQISSCFQGQSESEKMSSLWNWAEAYL